MQQKPLSGIRVLDLSRVIAGPLATLYLTQLGAEVIKVESPSGGDTMRASSAKAYAGGFDALNAGKRSLAIDIHDPKGAELIRALALKCDVIVENFRPGVARKYGLDASSLRAVRPDLVCCSLSGYGQAGEWASRGAYDHVIQALTGMTMMSGAGENDPPVMVGFPIVDVATGILGAFSIVSSLMLRQKTGEGAEIDVSMVNASLMMLYPAACAFLSSGAEPERIGNQGHTGSPGSDTFRCNDGWITVSGNTPAQFKKLLAALALQHLCDDESLFDPSMFSGKTPGFVVARDTPRARRILHEAFGQYSARELEGRLNAVGVPAARVRRLGEFLTEFQDGALLRIGQRSYDGLAGLVRTPGLGIDWPGDERLPTVGAPQLGDATTELLGELGLQASDIEKLHGEHVLACAPESSGAAIRPPRVAATQQAVQP